MSLRYTDESSVTVCKQQRERTSESEIHRRVFSHRVQTTERERERVSLRYTDESSVTVCKQQRERTSESEIHRRVFSHCVQATERENE